MIGNLTRAIAKGGDMESLLGELPDCEQRRDELRTAIAARERVQVQRIDRKAIEAAMRCCVQDWRGLLTPRPAQGRRRQMMAGPIQFTRPAEPTASKGKPRSVHC
jgi:hypothetical protein